MTRCSGSPGVRFSLAALFFLITLACGLMAVGRVFGYGGLVLLTMAPLPAVGYLVFVRSAMRNVKADYQTRSTVVNLALTLGLAAVILLTLAIAISLAIP